MQKHLLWGGREKGTLIFSTKSEIGQVTACMQVWYGRRYTDILHGQQKVFSNYFQTFKKVFLMDKYPVNTSLDCHLC